MISLSTVRARLAHGWFGTVRARLAHGWLGTVRARLAHGWLWHSTCKTRLFFDWKWF